MYIEDEEAIADLEKDYLELSGFEVEIEHRGDVGLKRSLTEDFNLVILDLMLPEMNGFDYLPGDPGTEEHTDHYGFCQER